ncbi:MAG: RNA-guided pseudouridylation complex pseudouridine synthase subunit Cbf5 [Candidatus Micrarchaeia archaeon]
MDVPELLDSGVVVLDKPCGPVSHEVTSWVRKMLGGIRAGHAGTLDPDVSGVLPVALGRATKLLKYISGKRKRYVGICKFKKELPAERIEDIFAKFQGEIEQTPPLVSAVKKVPRKRFVYSLEVLEVKGNRALFEANVEAGTYIRTLCEDIGKSSRTKAFMEELRRTSVGRIREDFAHTMQELADAHWLWKERGDGSLLKKCIVPVDTLLHFRRVYVHENAAESLEKGAQLMAPGLAAAEPLIRRGEKISIYTADRHKFVGVGIALFDGAEMNKKTRGKVVKSERIQFRA